MKLKFDFTNENKEKFKDYLEEFDKEARKLNIKKRKFGVYSTKDKSNFDKFIFFSLTTSIIYENALSCFVYEDKYNLKKVDAIKVFKIVKERNKQ